MAISKKETTESGQVIKYHRIIGLMVDMRQRQVHVDMASYTDQNYRDGEKNAENSINENIVTLEGELEETEAQLKGMEDSIEKTGAQISVAQTELSGIAAESPASEYEREFGELTAELATLGVGDEARITYIEKRKNELAALMEQAEKNKSDRFATKKAEMEKLTDEQSALISQRAETEKRRVEIIEVLQEWGAATIDPRFVSVQRYTLPADAATKILDFAYPEIMGLEPFSGSKKV